MRDNQKALYVMVGPKKSELRLCDAEGFEDEERDANDIQALEPQTFDVHDLSEYGSYSLIGKGGQSTVLMVRDSDGTWAVKVAETIKSTIALKEEYRLGRGIGQHPNVISPIAELGTITYRDPATNIIHCGYAVKYPYLNGQDLCDIVMESEMFDIEWICNVMFQILSALSWVHRLGLVHNDIKCDNIMITPEGAVLIDFGCAFYLRLVGNSVIPYGTPCNQAPEVSEGVIDYHRDTWALGIVLWAMLTGCQYSPNSELSEEETMRLQQCPQEALDVLWAMLCEHSQRKNVDELLDMEWFSRFDSNGNNIRCGLFGLWV